MRTYQQIIDEIETILASEQDPGESELAALENDYAQAITAVNTRLRKADELLRKGHRAEALGLCEDEPNLLDAVQILDFPDRDVWAEFVQDFGLPAPPQLKIEIASDLNDAYPQEQQLAPLLRRHRFLALARGDLRSRIDIMRKIAKVDRGNQIWTEDLKEFERTRHTEIQREFKAAVGRSDATAVAAIERELIDPRWLIAPPRTVIKQAQAEHARLRSVHARQDLVKLEPELTAAFADFDLPRGRTLRERWHAKAAIARVEEGDELLELVAPAFDWLDQEDRRERADAEYASAVAELERGLDDNVDRLELERRYHAVTRLERGLDPTLEQRLAERLRYLDVERTRKARLRLAAIISVVVVAGALVAFGIFRHLRSSTISTHAGNLQKLITNMQLGEARQYVQRLETELPYVFASAEVRGLIGELHASEQSDEGRRQRRQEHLANAERVLDGPQFQPVEAAAAAAEPAFAALDRSGQELDKARDLSSNDGELAEAKRVEGRISDLRQRVQSALDQAFQRAVEDLLARIGQASRSELSTLQQLRIEAQSLAGRKHVSVALLAQIPPVVARLDAMIDAARIAIAQERLLVEITKSVDPHDLPGFVRKLGDYAQTFPETQRARSFNQIATGEEDLWRGMEAWQSLIDTWRRKNLAASSAAEAAALVQQATVVLDQYGKFPAGNRLRELVEHLQSVTRRVDAAGQKLSLRLNDPLNNPTVFDIYVLRTTDGKSYYSKERPRMLGSDWQIKYVKDTMLRDTLVERFPPVMITNDKSGEGYLWEAPQFVFSRAAQDLLARMKDAEWETTYLAILDQLYESRNMDPVLKLQLMGILLQVACEGSSVLKQAFAGHVTDLQNARLGAVNWLDPNDQAGRNARLQAKGILARMKPPGDVQDEVRAALDRLRNPAVGQPHEWVGWLRRDGETWTCAVPENLKPAGRAATELFVLVRPAADADVTFEKIGEFRDGSLRMGSPTPSAFIEGRPVYALKK